VLSHLLLRLIAFAGFAHRNSLTRPENFTRPVVSRKLAFPTLYAAGPSAVGLAPFGAPVLSVVLHRTVSKVDDAFLASLTGFDHLLFPRPPTLHWLVAGHIRLGTLVHFLER